MDYHSEKFSDYSLLIYKGEKLIALLPANLINDQLFSHSGLSYGGFIFDDQSKYKDVVEVFKLTLEMLCKNNISTLNYKCIPSIYHLSPADESKHILFKLNAKLIKTELLSVVKQNRMCLSKDRKSGLSRGVKNNLIIKEVNEFDDFWNLLLIPNLKRKHNVLPVHSIEEISLLKNKFKNNIRQFNVYHDKDLIAGATIFETKTTAHVQYISSNSTKNKLGSLDFLFNHLIKNTFGDKSFFDFGNSNEENGEKLNKGLIYWKEGFGAKSVSQDFYKIETLNFINLDNLFI
jgi:hypothetical protein